MAIMHAARATGLRQIHCDEVPIPNPEQGKVLVKTNLASICGSDLHIVYMGWNAQNFPLPYGHPGHEGVGVVIDGGGTEFSPGDLVLTAPHFLVAKVFAEYQLIDSKYLLKLPEATPEAHLLMAQQLGTVIFGCRRLPSLIGQTIVVIGQGSVGLFHDFMLRRMGAQRIIVIEPIPKRLAAGKAMGVDEAIDVTGPKASQAVMDLTNGQGADTVIEAVGSKDTLNQALEIATDLGRVAVFGLPPTMDQVPFNWDAFFRKRLVIHAVHGAQDVPALPDFRLAVDLITRGEIDMSPFVTHQFPITQIQDAFDLADSKSDGALKVSLTF